MRRSAIEIKQCIGSKSATKNDSTQVSCCGRALIHCARTPALKKWQDASDSGIDGASAQGTKLNCARDPCGGHKQRGITFSNDLKCLRIKAGPRVGV